MERVYNLLPSPRDKRDWKFSKIVKTPLNIPRAFDLSVFSGPTLNQLGTGFCHSFAGAEVASVYQHRETGLRQQMSPLYLARAVKSLDGIKGTEGSMLVYVCKALSKFGTCKEQYYRFEKYVPGSLDFPEIEGEPTTYKVDLKYARTTTVQEMKESIAMFKPVLYGVTLCNNFRDAKEFLKLPTGIIIGRHGMTLEAYDDDKDFGDGHVGYFKTKNSHGPDWGIDGSSWIPYDYFTARYTVLRKDDGSFFDGDAWSMIDLKNDPIKQKIIEMNVGSKIMYVNSEKVEIDQAPFIMPETSRTVASIRAIVEALDCEVYWNSNGKITVIQEEK